MEFSSEKMREISKAANKIKRLDDFKEKLKKEIEERALNGQYYYKTCIRGVRDIEEVVVYFHSKGFEVEVVEERVLWIRW